MILIEKIKRKIDRDKKIFASYSTHYSVVRELRVLLWRIQGIQTNCVFENNLFENPQRIKDLKSNVTRKVCSWKNQIVFYEKQYTKSQRVLCFFDYCFSKLIYPGLTAFDYLAYNFRDFSHYKRKTFITVNKKKFIEKYNFNAEKDCELLSDKLQFDKAFSDYLNRRFWKASEISVDILEQIHSEGIHRLICKPESGGGGAGIFISAIDSPEERSELFEYVVNHPNAILEEVLIQHPAISEFNFSSINSLRVNTVRSKSGEIKVTAAVFRIGRNGATVDNYSSGGMAAEVDLSTGIVISTAVDHFGRRYLKHPDSGKVIIGFAIPYWPRVIETAISCHKRLEKIGYVGWDLSIMPDGRVSLIEGNSASAVDIQQSPGLDGKKLIYKQYL